MDNDQLIQRVVELIRIEHGFRVFEYETPFPVDQESFDPYFERFFEFFDQSVNLQEEIKMAIAMGENPFLILGSQLEEQIKRTKVIPLDQPTKEVNPKDISDMIGCLANDEETHCVCQGRQYLETFAEMGWLESAKEDFLPDRRRLFEEHFHDFEERYHESKDAVEYYEGLYEVGLVLSTHPVPESVQDYFLEIREAYAYSLYRSAIALCRSLIEISLKEKVVETGIVKGSTDGMTLAKLAMKATDEGLINQRINEQIRSVRKSANSLLHSHVRLGFKSQTDVIRMIKETVSIIEFLHSSKSNGKKSPI